MLETNKISFIGLGKLGLGLALSLASRGFEVLGIDIKEEVVNSINNGKSPIVEPQFQELISEFKSNFKTTLDHKRAIEETDVSFILVPTLSDSDGSFSNSNVESALKSLAVAFKNSDKKYHLFIISSTVMPGSTESKLIPLIEEYSGKKLNVDFGVCYVPDFVALGNVVEDFLNPDIVVIGESDKFAGDKLLSIYRKMCKNKPHIGRMSIISAEIAKVSLNAYITTKISFANTLANLCEKIPGADVDLITKTIGMDKRISPYYFKGGLAFGGPCFSRDTKAFIAFADKYIHTAELIKTVENVNEFQKKHLSELVLNNIGPSKTVSILGLAFKPNTPSIEISPGINLIKDLLEDNIKVTVYDSLAMDNTRALFGNKINYASSIRDCILKSEVLVITIPDKQFKNINGFDNITIIDCWRILNKNKLGNKIKYIAIGKNENSF